MNGIAVYKVPLGTPVRFLALEWREDWEFDHPTVLLEPVLRYTPNGRPAEWLAEETAIDICVEYPDGILCEYASDKKEFLWRRWSLEKLRSMAEQLAANPNMDVKLGNGYVGVYEKWLTFFWDDTEDILTFLEGKDGAAV